MGMLVASSDNLKFCLLAGLPLVLVLSLSLPLVRFIFISPLTLLKIIGFALRTLVFHPLARYPGPILGRFTDLYAGYYAWKGTLHLDMYRCHQKYGPIVRYGPNRLLIDTHTAAQDVHSHRANTIKSRAYQALVHSAPNTLTIRHKEDHARRRRVLSLAFSDGRMLGYESTVKGCIQALCDNLKKSSLAKDDSARESLVDMSFQSDWFTFDIMSEVIFGMKYEALKNSTYQHVTQAIQDSNVRVGTLVQAYSLTTARLDRYLFPASIQARNAFLKFITSLLRDRSKMTITQNNGDVFSFLETAKDPDNGKTLTKSEIRAECATLVVAGSDTSSSTLAATLFYLSENPGPYKRVCEEIRGKFASLDEIKLGAQLNSCTYLRACIDEALRMSPPVGGALWREVGAGGITVGSTHLPQGVDVGTGIYSLHHNASYFDEPFRFNPERWLAGENGVTKEKVSLARSAFHPFSSGPRGCIGKGFAYHEMTLTLSHIIYQFDFYRAEHSTGGAAGTDQRPIVQGHVQFVLKDHITGAKEGPELRFRER